MVIVAKWDILHGDLESREILTLAMCSAEVGHRYVKAIDVTEDWSAIRIPSAMDYSDNYVTGAQQHLVSFTNSAATRLFGKRHIFSMAECGDHSEVWDACPGLGMDFTSVDIEVMPPDPEASALPPSPVLLVATSDSALRFFTFAHMTKSTEGVVAPALPLSDTLPPMVAPEEQVPTQEHDGNP